MDSAPYPGLNKKTYIICIEFSIILSIYPQVICHIIIYIHIYHTNHLATIKHLLLFTTNCRYHWWHLPNAGGKERLKMHLGMDRMGGLGPHMLHVWNIYLYIYHKYVLNVGKCSSPIEHLRSMISTKCRKISASICLEKKHETLEEAIPPFLSDLKVWKIILNMPKTNNN